MKDCNGKNARQQEENNGFVNVTITLSNVTIIADPDMKIDLLAKTVDFIIGLRRRQKGDITPEQISVQVELLLRIKPSEVKKKYDGSLEINLMPSD